VAASVGLFSKLATKPTKPIIVLSPEIVVGKLIKKYYKKIVHIYLFEKGRYKINL
jgi:hypothetical protein